MTWVYFLEINFGEEIIIMHLIQQNLFRFAYSEIKLKSMFFHDEF